MLPSARTRIDRHDRKHEPSGCPDTSRCATGRRPEDRAAQSVLLARGEARRRAHGPRARHSAARPRSRGSAHLEPSRAAEPFDRGRSRGPQVVEASAAAVTTAPVRGLLDSRPVLIPRAAAWRGPCCTCSFGSGRCRRCSVVAAHAGRVGIQLHGRAQPGPSRGPKVAVVPDCGCLSRICCRCRFEPCGSKFVPEGAWRACSGHLSRS